MSEYNPIELLHCLPESQRANVTAWMEACKLQEDALTVPLVRLLATASELEDDGIKRVVAAMVEQEAGAPV